jgi:1,4-alpha-glucan branching enzyme
VKNHKVLQIIKDSPWLEAHAEDIQERFDRYLATISFINHDYGNLLEFARAHEYYGIHYDSFRKGWVYREWAPKAYNLFLMGDFNYWNRYSHPMKKNHRGDWEIFLPYDDYKNSFVHQSKVKVHIEGENGALDRIPAYIRRVTQDETTHDFTGQLWFPEKQFEWTDLAFDPTPNLRQPLIYECHVGMAQEKLGVGTYLEFAENILPVSKQPDTIPFK